MIDTLADGLVTIVNGLLALLGALASPVTLAVVAMVVSFAWLAVLETDELDRQGMKPDVGLH